MLKFSELKVGDLVMAEYDGNLKVGEIRNLNHDEKQVCIETQDQDFWYDFKHVKPIILDEPQLFKLGFTRQKNDDGSVKYSKGAFRVLTPSENDFSNFEMWYREDQRFIKQPIFVHEFQNKYLDMTKVHLTVGN